MMYGLSIIGGDVSPGDRVIIDYSHGTPFVRSNYTMANNKADTELEIYEDNYTPEFNPSTDGGGWITDSLKYRYANMTAQVMIYHHSALSQTFMSGIPQIIRWGDNELFGSIWYEARNWDSMYNSEVEGGIWPYTNKHDAYGSSRLGITKGKFLVNTYILLPIPDIYTFHNETHGWIRIRILQNGAPVAEEVHRWGRIPNPYNDFVINPGLSSHGYDWIGISIGCSCIVDGDYGDYIEVELTQTVCDTSDFESEWFSAFWYLTHFSVTGLPGTIGWIS
jgi:hypothetical protein